ncbi:hypothetical protein L602_001500001080 [Cupriavidus gilardii J11]|uniref:Uncharacterized protein n=1 Tax=Cupriavidus gilardii J11 TaxID=936133 RepID=A0A562BRR6_9BURK|nr:hypothetical protein [Cupriavidus gilardii]TWG87975.1 hypothetical protein L602_001500001080 [Cupriavidus gilardii J11]
MKQILADISIDLLISVVCAAPFFILFHVGTELTALSFCVLLASGMVLAWHSFGCRFGIENIRWSKVGG